MRKHYVVIVLGLGETKSVYFWLTRKWKKEYRLIPIIHVIGWKERKKDFEARLSILVEKIKQLLREEDASVSLIGISAGTSAIINAYSILRDEERLLIKSVILLCGRFNFTSHWWYPMRYGVKPYPAFEQSVALAEKNLEQFSQKEIKKIFVFNLIFDEVTPSSASSIKGATTIVFPLITHLVGIYAIFLWNKKLTTVLKDISI